MKEIRIHGRAGQGSITAAMLLARAAFEEGKFALAFPHFGAERMGAPMNAFVRLDDHRVRMRSQIYYPDYVIVQDHTLLHVPQFSVLDGLKSGGGILVNTDRTSDELGLETEARVWVVPATKIAQETIGRPLSNTALLGAFAACTDEVGLGAIQHCVRDRFRGEVGEKNALAAERAFQFIKGENR